MSAMFPYDPAILAVVQNPTRTIADVLQGLQTIDGLCVEADGLKWFNGLYATVTQTVLNRINAGGFNHPAWLAQLDVEFARLYFGAVRSALVNTPYPGCWEALFAVRDNRKIARVQFALAGVNAHINHDLCIAIQTTCRATGTVPQHTTAEYHDYSSLNPVLDSLIDHAKQTLNVRLPGDPLPTVSNLEQQIAAWNVSAARESAWKNAEHLWNLPQLLASGLMDTIDGFTAVISKSLLVPVP